jgi:hypothetical protein
MRRRVGDVRGWCVDSAEELWLLRGSGLLCRTRAAPLAAPSKRPVAQQQPKGGLSA